MENIQGYLQLHFRWNSVKTMRLVIVNNDVDIVPKISSVFRYLWEQILGVCYANYFTNFSTCEFYNVYWDGYIYSKPHAKLNYKVWLLLQTIDIFPSRTKLIFRVHNDWNLEVEWIKYLLDLLRILRML